MSDEFDIVENEVIVDSESQEVENEVRESEIENESSEEIENESKQVEQEVHKPWKQKQPENIPYSRFQEVNAERRELERRLAEYEERARKYDDLQKKTNEITSIDDLNKRMSEMSIEEYNTQVINLAMNKFKQEREIEDRRKETERIERDILDNFSKRVNESAKVNPEINEAVNYLTQFAGRIPAQTRYALLTDEHAGEVIYEIVTNENDLKFIMEANPIDVARKIAKLSSKYDNVPQKSTNEPVKAFVPKTAVSPNLRGNPTPNGKRKFTDAEIEKMSVSQYTKAKKEGRI